MTPITNAHRASSAAADAATKRDTPTGTSGGGAREQGEAADSGMVAAERDRVTICDALIAGCRRRAASKGMAMHMLDGELLFTWAGLPDVR